MTLGFFDKSARPEGAPVMQGQLFSTTTSVGRVLRVLRLKRNRALVRHCARVWLPRPQVHLTSYPRSRERRFGTRKLFGSSH